MPPRPRKETELKRLSNDYSHLKVEHSRLHERYHQQEKVFKQLRKDYAAAIYELQKLKGI